MKINSAAESRSLGDMIPHSRPPGTGNEARKRTIRARENPPETIAPAGAKGRERPEPRKEPA